MLSKNQIKELQALQLKKFREEKKLFLVEGVKSVNELIKAAPDWIVEIFALGDFIQQQGIHLSAQKIKVHEVTENELQRISLQNAPNKVLAVCRYLHEEALDVDLNRNYTFYLDDVRDPGNFGTIMRLADWYGIKHIFCSPTSCDVYNPKVIQSSMGAFLRVKLHYIELNELLAKVSFPCVYGALLDGEDLYSQKLINGLILIGNEANGIQEKNLKFIQKALTIPSAQSSKTESLNAAMASAIICSEFFRQLNSGQIK